MSAGTPLTSEIFNAREEILTSDLNRLQALASREVQDIAGQENTTDDARAGGDPQNGVGVPISAAELLPSMSFPGGFVMTLNYGSAWMIDFSVGNFGDATNGSPYVVTRWPTQNITFSTPDAGLPRIDLVVATPATVPTDSAARFVITDPIARSLNPATMNKTANPKATIAIVAGTPNSQPTAPAVPTGALALYEVYVPAGAANAAAFSLSRRIWRRSVGVMATAHAVLSGCIPSWGTSPLDESASVSLTYQGAAGGLNRAIINGEMITFGVIDSGSATLPGVVADAGAASPYAAAAPANNDQVYYLYLCGGSSLPQGRFASSALQPVCVVESLTAPNKDGRPSAAITTPRGTTQDGALYIGVGYIVQNTTFRKACHIEGDWVYGMAGQNFSPFKMAGANDTADRVGALSGSARVGHSLNTKPALATQARVGVGISTDGSAAVQFTLGLALTPDATRTTGDGFVGTVVSSSPLLQRFDFLARTGASNHFIQTSPVAGLTAVTHFYMWAQGWNMNVPRLSL